MNIKKTCAKITVITVVRNGASTLEQTMLSVLNQTYNNIEYIVIDGASTDGTLEIVKRYDERIKNGEFPSITFRWISEPDSGIYDAMNKGIDLATGEWINFMNSGDSFYNKNTIETFFNFHDTSADIVYGNTYYNHTIGAYLKTPLPLSNKNYMPTCHQAFFVKTVLLQKMHFNTDYKICADRYFFYEVNKLGYKFQHVPCAICNYECETGFSTVNALKVFVETGDIEKINKTFSWKIKYIKFVASAKIKSTIKYLLPKSIVIMIRKKRMQKFNV